MSRRTAQVLIVAAIVVLGIIALVAWARNDAGIDDRDPDPPSTVVIVVPAPTTTVAPEPVPTTTP